MFSTGQSRKNVAEGSRGKSGMPEKGRKKSVRLTRFEFTMTPEERERLEAQAVERGLTSAAFLRTLILGTPLPDRKAGVNAEAVAALNRIGSNVNQIAKVGNSSRTLSAAQISALAAHLRRLDVLVREIGGRVS